MSKAWGDERRTLTIGPWAVRFEGLDGATATALDRRWGGFVSKRPAEEPRIHVAVVHAAPGSVLPPWKRGESYRLEPGVKRGRPLVRSYRFVLEAGEEPGRWTLGLASGVDEPIGRALDNAARYLWARLAAREGGFALHGAGILRSDRVYVLAGPSGSGKTTAVSLSRPARSLGDDFAMVIPEAKGWVAPAVPFDNLEIAPADPPPGLMPVEGIWRLFHAPETQVVTLPRIPAVASLMGCIAFPWAMPDLADAILEHATRFVAEGVYAHLQFRKSPEFWGLLPPLS